MNVYFKSVNEVRKFQEGGPMGPAPEEGGAPMPPEQGGAPEGGSPEEQLAGVAQQLVEMLMQQVGDPQAVMAILQMAMEMVQGGGQPAPEPQEQPVYAKGGILLRRIKK